MHANIYILKYIYIYIIYAVPVLGTRWFHATQSQLRCFCHNFSFINQQVDSFKEHFRQAHFNIQLCNIDVALVTLSARRVAGSTAVFVSTGPQLFHQRKSNLKPTHSDRCPCDAASTVGSKSFWTCRCLLFFFFSLRPLASALHLAKVQTDRLLCLPAAVAAR